MDAVLFDLFGTLVPPYRKAEHHAALRGIADVLGRSFDDVLSGWSRTWDARATGGYRSIGDNLRDLVPDAADDDIERAHRIYHGFTVQSLEPKPGAFEVLRWLRERGVARALVTNCAPDVPELWAQTPWADWFDVTVFSCGLGTKKPDPAMYHAALDPLGVAPHDATFVGDGSDRELEGAADVGLTPILVRNEGDAAPPVAGIDVVDHLAELIGLWTR